MSEGGITVENGELLTPREFRRDFPSQLKRLQDGEIDKLVLMHRNEMAAVVVPIERYIEMVKK